MANINEILARAAALRNETALNSIDPERAGGIMYDTLIALNELWLQQGAALVLSKIYASVAAMNADTSPVSDLTGKSIRPGMVVVIASSDSDNGSVYRYNGPDSPSWSLVGKIGNLEPVDSLDSDSTQLPLAARQGKVLDGKINQLGQKVNYLPGEIQENLYPVVFEWTRDYVFDGDDDVMTLNNPITLEQDGDFVEIALSTTLINANTDPSGQHTGGTNRVYSFGYRQHPTNPAYKYVAVAFSKNRFFAKLASDVWIGLFSQACQSPPYATTARVGYRQALCFSFSNNTFSRPSTTISSQETKEDTAFLFIQCLILYAAAAIIVLTASPRVPLR